MDAADNSIIWLEKAFTIYKDADISDRNTKNIMKNVVQWLSNSYMWKREKVKGKDVKAYDAFDAKYKEYDVLYDKYK